MAIFEFVDEPSSPAGWNALDKPSIEAIVNGISGAHRLGQIVSAESVPYPITKTDVEQAIKYVLNHHLVESYVAEEGKRKREGLNTNRRTRESLLAQFPIQDDQNNDRDMPVIDLNLNHAPPAEIGPGTHYKGMIVNIDKKGKPHPIITFYPK